MLKKMIAAAAVAGGVALLAPQAANAASQSTSITVPPGNRVCLDSSSLAFSSARADGFANPGVKFTFLARPYGSTGFTQLSESGTSTTAYAAVADRSWMPWAFPGQFRVCARNLGTTSAQVQLYLSTY